MSPKNRILSLRQLCIDKVSKILIYTLSDDENFNFKYVKKYLSDATSQIHQDLLTHILDAESIDAWTRFSCLGLLLNNNVKVLETGVFPHSYYENILEVIIRSGSGIQILNLRGVWVHDRPELLGKVFETLKQLKVVTMPHIVDDLVLKSLMLCEKLSCLDISGDCQLSANVLSHIKSNSIKVLHIGSNGKKGLCYPESKSDEVLAKIIENFPNLTVIRTYGFVGSAILNIYLRNPFFQSRLMYLHDTRTTTKMCEAIIKLCPNLESAYFDTPQEKVLSMLIDLKLLKSLKLARFNSEEFISYLAISGSRLHALQLNHCRDGQIDLSQICLHCPDLLHLDCFKISLKFTQADYYFMALKSLDILYCGVSDYIIKCLLTNSPLLKRVAIGDVIKLTDGDLFRLCADCSFADLEELWFSCAKSLTATSVQLLMGHCPNLKSLGQLSMWDVNPEEMDSLRHLIAITNTNLILLPTGFP